MAIEMNTTELIINKALNIIANNPFDYADYDESQGLGLADAITVIVMDGEDHDTKLESAKVYDLVSSLVDGTDNDELERQKYIDLIRKHFPDENIHEGIITLATARQLFNRLTHERSIA